MAYKVEQNTTTPSNIKIFVEFFILIIRCMYELLKSAFFLIKEKPQKSVKGDIVLITGAGHGIGKELAKKYASEGATVVCWDINKQSNEKTVHEIKQLGYPQAYAYVCDVTNPNDVETVAKKVKVEVGCVTILVNNAGIATIKPLLKTTSADIVKTIKTNTMSHFWTIKAFLPEMQRTNRGHIVAICSIAGLYGARNGVPYCSSKFAVRGMMEALFQELRVVPENKISTTVIYPSGVNTGMFKKAHSRFPRFLPIITPKEAAAHILKAQRQEWVEYTIPRYNMGVHNLARLLPIKAQDIIQKFLDIYVIE